MLLWARCQYPQEILPAVRVTIQPTGHCHAASASVRPTRLGDTLVLLQRVSLHTWSKSCSLTSRPSRVRAAVFAIRFANSFLRSTTPLSGHLAKYACSSEGQAGDVGGSWHTGWTEAHTLLYVYTGRQLVAIYLALHCLVTQLWGGGRAFQLARARLWTLLNDHHVERALLGAFCRQCRVFDLNSNLSCALLLYQQIY